MSRSSAIPLGRPAPSDDHDHVTVLTVEDSGKIDGNLGEVTVVDSGVDGLFCCQRPRYVERKAGNGYSESDLRRIRTTRNRSDLRHRGVHGVAPTGAR